MTPEIENRLSDYHWPGNIRELINVIERSVILSKEDNLELNLQTNDGNGQDLYLGDTPTLNELERRYIQHILQKTKGRIAGSGGAADLLGLKPSTLYSRMAKLLIQRHK